MSEHQGQRAEVVGTAPTPETFVVQARPQRAAKPNPARWVLQSNGQYRWWGGGQWTDHMTTDPSSPDPVLAAQEAARAIETTPAVESAAPAPSGQADELAKLAELHRSGVLSDDEFAAAKRRVLGL